jgi:trehalose 6-phosphate synthase/phosphatase
VDRSRFILELDGRTIHVKSLPIGIPYDHFAQLSRSAQKVLKEKGQQVILGVDRLDYTKGLVNRVKAFERLLEKHPEHLEKVTFLQVCEKHKCAMNLLNALPKPLHTYYIHYVLTTNFLPSQE